MSVEYRLQSTVNPKPWGPYLTALCVVLIYLTSLAVLPRLNNEITRDISRLPGALPTSDEQAVYQEEYSLAVDLIQEGHYDQAELIYRQLTTAEPENSLGYVGLGSSLLLQNKLDEAQQAYQYAIELDPGDVYALGGLGSSALKQGDFGRAEGYYQRALDIQPDLPDLHWGMALAAEGQRKDQEAIDHLERFLDLAPDSSLDATLMDRARGKIDFLRSRQPDQ